MAIKIRINIQQIKLGGISQVVKWHKVNFEKPWSDAHGVKMS